MSHNPRNPSGISMIPCLIKAGLIVHLPVDGSSCPVGERYGHVLQRVTMPFDNWGLMVVFDEKSTTAFPRFWLQVYANADLCARSGVPYDWKGREWMLRENMTDSEIMRTAFLAVRGAVEHELFEKFLIDGQRPFDPHLNLTNLAEFASQPNNSDEP